jgi:diguanylate cyclase (GGDEF)-like protein
MRAIPHHAFADRDPEVQRLQVENSLKMVHTAIVGGIFNAIVAAVTLWSGEHRKIVSAWMILLLAISGVRFWHYKASENVVRSPARTLRDERIITAIALASGSVWGIGMAGAGFMASALQFNLLAMLSGGMLGAAVLTYGPLPRAAFAFILPFTVGGSLAWAVSPVASTIPGLLLICSYAAVLVRTVLANERIFVDKVMSKRALIESADTVQLLLNDYEAQSADWLWSVDSEGRIRMPSERFGEASGRPVQLLDGLRIVELFDHGPERDMLADHIRGERPFRDLTLKLTLDSSPCWWTLSARPRDEGGMRGVASDVTAQKRAEERVSYMAHYDGLTDLANRFLFNETLSRALKRQKAGRDVAVLYLDLDQFKAVNDTLGHPVGDRLLCGVARRIESAVRARDLVCRLGGDEFAVLMLDIAEDGTADQVARRIITAIDKPFVIDALQVSTSTSIGIATSTGPGSDAADLMKKADLALYAAKANGRNRHAHFEPGMDLAARERREVEMDLRAALSRNEFELYYQPLINLETHGVVGYEALLRWNHPERGVVMPSTFIPIAEETGLIVRLGEWVIRAATREVATWPEDLFVSINLSPEQMHSANLVSVIVNAVAFAGIDPARLEFEITESVLMHDSEVNLATLHKLKEIGVRIALDDFGTGYSSLNYLRAFPFDKIKIDRCFVDGIEHREDCRAIVRAVTGLATSLGMTTTAEGVEHAGQLDNLREAGCTEVQGYLFSAPVRTEELTDLSRRPERSGGSCAPDTLSAKPAATPDIDEFAERKRSA